VPPPRLVAFRDVDFNLEFESSQSTDPWVKLTPSWTTVSELDTRPSRVFIPQDPEHHAQEAK
jgi:hypothetical protein